MNGKIMLALFSLAAVCCPQAFAVHEEPVKVEAEGQVVLGDDSTIGQAKAAALNNARRAALEKATGVDVRGSSLVYNYQLINDLVLTATKGVIVKEDVLENRCRMQEERIFCTARIRAEVKPLHMERRGDLAVTRAAVLRYGAEATKQDPVFQNRDEIQVRATVNADAWLHLFSVDQNGNIAKLYPNDYAHADLVPANREFAFPEKALRDAGVKLRVATPKGAKKAVESVMVIALRSKKQLLSGDIENPTITDLMQELSNIDPSQWVERTLGYEVRE